MAKERFVAKAKRIQLDEPLQARVSDFRFRERIGSENEAFRRLLRAGLEVWEGYLKRRDLVGDALNLLRNAVEEGHCEVPPTDMDRAAGRLMKPKGLYLDVGLAQGVERFEETMRYNESQAIRELLQIGLDQVEARSRTDVEEAVFMLRIEHNRYLARREEAWKLLGFREDLKGFIESAEGLFGVKKQR